MQTLVPFEMLSWTTRGQDASDHSHQKPLPLGENGWANCSRR